MIGLISFIFLLYDTIVEIYCDWASFFRFSSLRETMKKELMFGVTSGSMPLCFYP